LTTEPGTDSAPSRAPGTLETFHLGLASDGTSCAMVFMDEQHRSIACIASFADLNGFIVSLTRAAAEMARRRAVPMRQDAAGDDGETASGAQGGRRDAFNVAFADFKPGDDGYVVGSLIDDAGEVVRIRMPAHVASEMTRNVLRAAPTGSIC